MEKFLIRFFFFFEEQFILLTPDLEWAFCAANPLRCHCSFICHIPKNPEILLTKREVLGYGSHWVGVLQAQMGGRAALHIDFSVDGDLITGTNEGFV